MVERKRVEVRNDKETDIEKFMKSWVSDPDLTEKSKNLIIKKASNSEPV